MAQGFCDFPRILTIFPFSSCIYLGVERSFELFYSIDAYSLLTFPRHATTWLSYTLISLPTPHGNFIGNAEDVNKQSNILFLEYLEPKKVQNILLLGYQRSNTSTIFKQVGGNSCENI